ncbi:MAG: HEAT repeat domain-containing protein [Blastocatellia bacterium]|nr:HEAT repeat domain-containing protein [Blastocatellia bacterium]
MNRAHICNRGRDPRRRFTGAILLFALLCVGSSIYAQQPDPSVKSQMARLAAGDEEARLDAVARLADSFASSVGRPVDPELVPALIRSLQSDSSAVIRALAARALGVSSDSRVIAPLTGALAKEREIAVKKAILYALARYPFNSAAPALTSTLPLLPLLQDKKPEIRAAAAFALAEIRDPAAAPQLLAFLQKRRKDEDAFARAHAARALGLLAYREALDPLAASLSKDHSQEVRREAAGAIGLLASESDARAIEALSNAVKSEDPYLSRFAENALALIRLRSRPAPR